MGGSPLFHFPACFRMLALQTKRAILQKATTSKSASLWRHDNIVDGGLANMSAKNSARKKW